MGWVGVVEKGFRHEPWSACLKCAGCPVGPMDRIPGNEEVPDNPGLDQSASTTDSMLQAPRQASVTLAPSHSRHATPPPNPLAPVTRALVAPSRAGTTSASRTEKKARSVPPAAAFSPKPRSARGCGGGDRVLELRWAVGKARFVAGGSVHAWPSNPSDGEAGGLTHQLLTFAAGRSRLPRSTWNRITSGTWCSLLARA